MSQVNGSKLSGPSQGQDPNKPSNGKRFRIKQGGSKFKGPKGVSLVWESSTHNSSWC